MMTGVDRAPVTSVSVVIPLLDNVGDLAAQLHAVTTQECRVPFEIVVADNGSTDGSLELAAAWSTRDGRVRVVDASDRPGPAAARNRGVATSVADAVAFCDADDVVAPGWLQALVDELPDADVVAGACDFASLNGGEQGKTVVSHASHFGFLPAGLGANLAIRRAVLLRIGGFDEELQVGEDIDLCWRAQLAGHRFVSATEPVVARRDRAAARPRRTQLMRYGRSEAALFRRFRGEGMPRNVGLTAKTYGWLMLNLPRAAVDPVCRTRWTRAFYVRWGRMCGSVEHRVLFP